MKSIIFKRIGLLFTILLLSVTMLPLSSCGNDDDEPSDPNSIIGTWVERDDEYPMCVQFKNDHTGAMWLEEHGKIDTRYTYDKFTWTLEEDVISFKITSGESNWNPMEDWDEYEIKNGVLDWYGYYYVRRK